MKSKITLCLFIVLMTSCGDRESRNALSTARDLMTEYPDSAFQLLESAYNPGMMSVKTMAEWNILTAEIRDSLRMQIAMDTAQFHKVVDYYEKNYPYNEKAKAGFYYGRALADANDSKTAIPVYLEALERAEIAENYNLAGYISSYAADLYWGELNAPLAGDYYVRAANFFEKAGNTRSHIIALRDIGRMYYVNKQNEKALDYILIADSLCEKIDDIKLKTVLKDLLANIYLTLENYELSEKYLNQSIQLSEERRMAYYYIQVQTSISQKDYNLARIYLDSISLKTDLENKSVFNYFHYTIEKDLGNFEKALGFYEKAMSLTDSLWSKNHAKELYEIEQKYRREHLINANNQLKLQRQYYWIVVISLGLLAVILAAILISVFYHRKNKELRLRQDILKKEKEIETQRLLAENRAIALLAKENELEQIKKRFTMMKDFLLERSLFFEKIKLISDLPLRGNKQEAYDKNVKKIFNEPSISDTDWELLREIIMGLHPNFINKLQAAGPQLSQMEIDFCCLLLFGLPTEKIVVLLNIANTTLKSKRHRIATKLNLVNSDIRLEDYLETLL